MHISNTSLSTGHFIAFLFLLYFLNFSTAVNAAVDVQIDSAIVEMADNTAESRREAFKQALGKVLIKLSGTRDILDAPETQNIISSASRYVQAYNMEKVRDSTDGQSGSEKGLAMHVEFDGPALERILVTAGLPVWSGTRPAVLVWLAVEDNRNRYVLSESSASSVLPLLQVAADSRGVPLIIPVMDRTDRYRVEFIDVQAGFNERLTAAAERYNTDIMLIGNLKSVAGNSWSAKWTVLREHVSSSWTETGLSLAIALQSGVDGLADMLASRYAFVSAPGGKLSEYLVSVDNVTELEHYAKILSILRKLVFVESVTPVRIKETQVQYRLRIHGGIQELERTLSLSGSLVPLTSPVSSESYIQPGNGDGVLPPQELHFSWKP